jgi:post-segregation antitoxin (ccd killing protein)
VASTGVRDLGDAWHGGALRWATAAALAISSPSIADVYSVRMTRVNITMPDELYIRAKQSGLNVSQIAQRGVSAELSRLTKLAELDAYLAELEAERGPTSEEERAGAKAWADQALGTSSQRHSA